jgi:hypothetical protein
MHASNFLRESPPIPLRTPQQNSGGKYAAEHSPRATPRFVFAEQAPATKGGARIDWPLERGEEIETQHRRVRDCRA